MFLVSNGTVINQDTLLPVCVMCIPKGGYKLVTLPRILTPYRDSVDGTHDRVTNF